MSNPTKNLGTKHESDIVNWFKAHGWRWAHRRTLKGSSDEGDVCLSERIPFTIEAKTAKKTTDRAALGSFVSELKAEVEAVGDEAGAVVFKKRGTTDVGEYYAIMPVSYLNTLLTRAYGEDEKPAEESSSFRNPNRVIPDYR